MLADVIMGATLLSVEKLSFTACRMHDQHWCCVCWRCLRACAAQVQQWSSCLGMQQFVFRSTNIPRSEHSLMGGAWDAAFLELIEPMLHYRCHHAQVRRVEKPGTKVAGLETALMTGDST